MNLNAFFYQTLRQRIDDEYREVVERRVITGLIISVCQLSESIIIIRLTTDMIRIPWNCQHILTHILFVWFYNLKLPEPDLMKRLALNRNKILIFCLYKCTLL